MTFTSVLALDIAGNPFDWITPNEAVTLYAKGKIAWDLGHAERVFLGGYSRSGVQSRIAIRPIIALAGSEIMASFAHQTYRLGERDNTLLFERDRYTCGYCAQTFSSAELTRDHIFPRCKGGEDSWTNCVTACKACNSAKGSRLVHDFKPLVFLPYVPSRWEYHLLSGRNILADQHDYLAMKLPAESRLRH